MLMPSAFLLKNPNFQGRWSTWRWPWCWTLLKKYRCVLVPLSSKCFRTHASGIRKIEILQNISAKCFFTKKNPNFQGHWRTSRWPWTFMIKYRGCLGTSSKCFHTHASVIRKKETLKNHWCQVLFYWKIRIFKVVVGNQDDLEKFWKSLGGVLV